MRDRLVLEIRGKSPSGSDEVAEVAIHGHWMEDFVAEIQEFHGEMELAFSKLFLSPVTLKWREEREDR